jgi:hypothetical protein
MKVDLPNHQSVCLYVCVVLTNNDAFQGDLEAIIFNPIASTILK